MESSFLYEFRPTRPTLLPGQSLRTNKPVSLNLTKVEVMDYMKYGPLYRRFTDANVNPIKVTGTNLSKLHVATYAEYEALMKTPVTVNMKTESIKEQELEEPKKLNEEESLVEDNSSELIEESDVSETSDSSLVKNTDDMNNDKENIDEIEKVEMKSEEAITDDPNQEAVETDKVDTDYSEENSNSSTEEKVTLTNAVISNDQKMYETFNGYNGPMGKHDPTTSNKNDKHNKNVKFNTKK